MPREIDILIADGASTRIGRTVLKSLRKRGLVCEAIDDSGVFKDEYGYLRLLKASLKGIRPKVLMPVFKGELIARHISMVPGSDVRTDKELAAILEGITIPVSSAETINLLDDKVRASALCAQLEIPQPRLYSDEEALEKPEMLFSTPGKPVVFKRSTGLGGDSVYFPKSEVSLANILGSAGVKGRPHLIMDYIDGYDVSIDAIRWNGWFRSAGYRTMVPKRKGTSLVRIGVDRPDITAYVRKILDTVDYNGVCGVDFRIDRKSGKAFFMECNPRFSGGLKSSIAAGFDIPFVLWQLCCEELPQVERIRSGRLSVEWKEILSR